MQPTVRYAKEEDLERVNVLRRAVNELHANGRPDFFRPDFCEALQRHAEQVLHAADADVIVACLGDALCGFAMVQYVDRPESPYMCARKFYHIEEFGVDAAFRRQGIGTALIDFCRSEAVRKGFGRLELDVWAFNEAARKFYEAIGFQTYRCFMETDV